MNRRAPSPARAAWEQRSSQCDCSARHLWDHEPDCLHYRPLKRWTDDELAVEHARLDRAVASCRRGYRRILRAMDRAIAYRNGLISRGRQAVRRSDELESLRAAIDRERALREAHPFVIVDD